MSAVSDSAHTSTQPGDMEANKNAEKVNPNVGTAPSSLEERISSQAPRPDGLKSHIPWSRRLNPLKSSTIPPVPDERQPSGEHTASLLSKLVFHWVTPLMHVSSYYFFSRFFLGLLVACIVRKVNKLKLNSMQVGYQRPLESNDIWLVNPERSLDVLEQKFNVEFQKHVAAGSRRPLLVALLRTFKKEFLLGAFCQLMSTIAMTVSPFLLRFLISFATEAFNAKETGGHGPNIGYGVGLVVIITALQILMTFSINHFMYWGMTVGGEARAVLMSMIFAKSLRISGRAKAGGYVLPRPSNAKPGSEDEKRYKKALTKSKGTNDKKNESYSRPANDTDGWSNGRIVNLMSTDTYRIDQASGMIRKYDSSPAMDRSFHVLEYSRMQHLSTCSRTNVTIRYALGISVVYYHYNGSSSHQFGI